MPTHDDDQAFAARRTTADPDADAFVPLTDWFPADAFNRAVITEALREVLVGHERIDRNPDNSDGEP